MPLYEYGCEACGHVVEKLQSSPEALAPEVCPKCETTGSMKRLISNTSFKLKGSGWYVTDYASPTKSAEASGETNGDSSEGSESSGDSPLSQAPASSESSSESSSAAGPEET